MKPDEDKKCGVCATSYFERNNYFYGKQFTVRDLLQEQSYLNGKRQLINRMVLGWGVVCGLDVRWRDDTKRELVVTNGMALDCCGHEIIVCEDRYLDLSKEIKAEASNRALDKQNYVEGKYMLCLEYEKCKTEPVDLPPLGCEKEGRVEYNRVRDGYKLRLKLWDEACAKQPYGHVRCLCRFKHESGSMRAERSCQTPTIHEHLCSDLQEGCPQCECCDCVVLATIYTKPPAKEGQLEVAQQQQGGNEGVDVQLDTCTDRRLVYNNSLLYDLIYCHHGDLPHIVDFSWREHTYPDRTIEWETFVQMMNDGLTVYFDRQMDENSLNKHTFLVSYLLRDSGTGTYLQKRIPVQDVTTGDDKDCYTATFVPRKRWLDNELKPDESELVANPKFSDDGVDVEITLRGSRIWSAQDKKGLDGEFLADKLPTGNGTQGGDFVDWFRVLVPGREKQRAAAPPAESYKDAAPPAETYEDF